MLVYFLRPVNHDSYIRANLTADGNKEEIACLFCESSRLYQGEFNRGRKEGGELFSRQVNHGVIPADVTCRTVSNMVLNVHRNHKGY